MWVCNTKHEDWISTFARNHGVYVATPDTDITFLCILWWQWRWRNDMIFNNENITYHGICKIIDGWISTNLNVFLDDDVIFAKPTRLVSWNKPMTGYYKINTDGSSFGNPGRAGYGGLIRDSNGIWVVDFSGFIGITTCMHAKLKAMLQGLTLARILGIKMPILESDSKEAVEIISKGDTLTHHYGNIIQDIRDLLMLEENFSITHILREANSCADLLPKIGAKYSSSYTLWDDLLMLLLFSF